MPAILKEGPYREIVFEAMHLEELGAIAPKVYHFGKEHGHRGYTLEGDIPLQGFMVMEQLPAYPETDLLLFGLQTLEQQVWIKQAPSGFVDFGWQAQFKARFGFDLPGWTLWDNQYCLIHGDPTLANMRFNGQVVRFIDPKPPGNGIPPFASIDRGKIMQSWLGWEKALYQLAGTPLTTRMDHLYAWEGPYREQVYPFRHLSREDLKVTMFWCMVHFLRIVQREKTSPLGKWSRQNALEIAEELEMGDAVRLGLGQYID